MSLRRLPLLLPFLVLMLAACDDSTSPGLSKLTAAEAAALAVALDNSSSSAVQPTSDAEGAAFALAAPGDPASGVITRRDEFELEIPCPRGGNSTLLGEHLLVIDTEAGFITVDVTASKGHEACSFRSGEGLDVTVDGTVSFQAAREFREGQATASQSHLGSLDYVTSDGKEGTCAIDITTEFVLTAGAASRNISGSVCGHEVDVSTTWTHTQ